MSRNPGWRLETRLRCYCQFLGTDLLASHWYQLPGEFQAGIYRRREVWKGRGSLSVHKEILSGKGTLSKILGASTSSHSCMRVTVTPGVLVEAVEGMGGDWPVPPDSPFLAGLNLMSKGFFHFSRSLPSCLPLFQHSPLCHVLLKVPEGAKAHEASCPGPFQFCQPILRARGQELWTEFSCCCPPQ